MAAENPILVQYACVQLGRVGPALIKNIESCGYDMKQTGRSSAKSKTLLILIIKDKIMSRSFYILPGILPLAIKIQTAPKPEKLKEITLLLSFVVPSLF